MKHIAILDYGSQYTHLITRRIRELKVLAKIYPHNTKASELKEAEGIILSGGPQSVFGEDSLRVDQEIFNLNVPILGLCYGHQLISHTLGGEVICGDTGEYGYAELEIKNKTELFKDIKEKSTVWMSHGDSVSKAPSGFTITGSTPGCGITAIANEDKKIYGLQFHPEVNHSEQGSIMIKNFVLNICQAEQNWQIDDQINDLIDKIKTQAKNKKVFILVSGGVDSSVAFALLTKALGEDRVLGLYINNGFMRHEESSEIKKIFSNAGFHNLEMIDSSSDFYKNLVNIYEPETKRKIVGKAFLEAKDKASQNLKLNQDEWLLGQGTIYPDTIETGGTNNADIIKTHHNRIDAIQDLINQGLVIEPLLDFYKDEVREIGRLLNLSPELVDRHPFPGPGLSIRCLCNEHPSTENLKTEKIKNFYLENYPNINYDILPIKSVGVQGDNRTYAHPIAIWNETNWKTLDQISTHTTNSSKEVNRALLLLNPPKNDSDFTLLGNKYLTESRVDLLREIDYIVNTTIKEDGLYSKIWQFPIILIPITDQSGKESIVLRPITSQDAMTACFYQMPQSTLDKISKRIQDTNKISYIFYDITNKPPGTIEWE